jgi:hypothetical protein
MDTSKSENFVAARLVRQASFVVEAPRALVFPLLCPVRERDWLPGWQADVVYSKSGLVEDGCIFRSRNPKLGEGLYATSRHEPEAGIVEFVVFYPGILVMKLDILATATGLESTRLRWRRTYTALGPEGRAFLDGLTEEVFNQQMQGMHRSLAEHCRRLQGTAGR